MYAEPPKENSLNEIAKVGCSGLPKRIFVLHLKTNSSSLLSIIYILVSPSFQTHTLENLRDSLLFSFPSSSPSINHYVL